MKQQSNRTSSNISKIQLKKYIYKYAYKNYKQIKKFYQIHTSIKKNHKYRFNI